MMTNPIGGLNASNAVRYMQSSNALLGFTRNISSFTGNPAILASAENRLTLNMLQDSLTYKLGILQEKQMKKINDENIKRTFSVFA